jgi:serine/threonine protein kinase
MESLVIPWEGSDPERPRIHAALDPDKRASRSGLMRPSAGSSTTSTAESRTASPMSVDGADGGRSLRSLRVASFPEMVEESSDAGSPTCAPKKKPSLSERRGLRKVVSGLNLPRRKSEEERLYSLRGELDSYVVQEAIGQGSSSVAYLSYSAGGSRHVIKRMRNRDPEYLSSLGAEFRLLQSLSHPNIIRATDVAADMSWMALEFIDESRTLWSCVKASGALTPEVANVVMRNLTSAVAYIHERGVCHRDVNPENVLLVGALGDLRLFDFNASITDAAANLCLSPGGNPAYMPPEVLYEGIGFAGDVWGIGATLYFAVCAQFDRGARGLFQEAAWKAAPAPLKRCIGRCLEANPELRLTAPDLLEALEVACGLSPAARSDASGVTNAAAEAA